MKLFILEDDAQRMKLFNEWFKDHEITHAEHAKEAIALLAANEYDIIFLDHDLGGRTYVNSADPDTGYQVAKTIPEGPNDTTPVVVHSMNENGAKNIMSVLIKNQKIFSPFGPSLKNVFQVG